MSKTLREPLPSGYYYFFWLFEPLFISLGGAVVAFSNTADYAYDLIPPNLEPATNTLGQTIRGKLILQTFGCACLWFALLPLTLWPIIKNKLKHMPEVQESFTWRFEAAQTIVDIVMLAVNVVNLPLDLVLDPSKWTNMMLANFIILPGLLIVRSAWLLGIGRREVRLGKTE